MLSKILYLGRNRIMQALRHIFFLCVLIVLFSFQKSFAQKKDSLIKSNVAIMAGCSILDGDGIRVELPSFFYGSNKHAFSIAPAGNFTSGNSSYGGFNLGYYYFIEPSFRDITFYLMYNTAYFFHDDAPITHVFGIGTQIDIGKRGFIQHSVGFGFQQSTSDFSSMGPAGQLKLSFGIYLREIPVVHIHDEWQEHQAH